ncbi:MAG TPA: ABC transporter ATP-binding protein [Candidatus Limnocylindria bacterium]|jgi:branched-chain amino acid transport system ATP-binding protein|nr:ABC transporter ATP-binding protein [Candidatus Limnocylindria bacterium]
MPLLEISGLVAGYGAVSVLHDLALHVDEHEAVALVGANAAGKTTLLRTISGIVPARAGSIRLGGRELLGLGSHEIAAAGIVQVAEGRQLFPEMSVLENLELGAMASSEAWSGRAAMIERVIRLFPRVGERLAQWAGTMSGGEQQQVAIGRALMARPKILLVDEPSAGLSPLLVQAVFRALKEIHAEGTTILLVEQNVPLSLRLAQRAYVIELGRVVLEGTGTELLANPHVQAAYLGRA